MRRTAGWSLSILLAGLLLASLLTACGSSSSTANEDPPGLESSIDLYQAYVVQNVIELIPWVNQLVDLAEAGEVTRAQSRYASARVPYGHIEPIVATFPALEARIDGIEGEREELAGFHWIERGLWADGAADGLKGVKAFRADIEELRVKVEAAAFDMRPGYIAASANRALAEISSSEIAGKEEHYSHLDLVDIAANVEGVEAAFKALKPLLLDRDPDLAKEIEAGFEEAYEELKQYGAAAREPDQPRASSPGVSFVLYSELSAAEVRRLASRIEALSELFSQVPDEVG